MTMTDENNDKTEKIREEIGDGDAVGGSIDSDGGAVLTLDDGTLVAHGKEEGDEE